MQKLPMVRTFLVCIGCSDMSGLGRSAWSDHDISGLEVFWSKLAASAAFTQVDSWHKSCHWSSPWGWGAAWGPAPWKSCWHGPKWCEAHWFLQCLNLWPLPEGTSARGREVSASPSTGWFVLLAVPQHLFVSVFSQSAQQLCIFVCWQRSVILSIIIVITTTITIVIIINNGNSNSSGDSNKHSNNHTMII